MASSPWNNPDKKNICEKKIEAIEFYYQELFETLEVETFELEEEITTYFDVIAEYLEKIQIHLEPEYDRPETWKNWVLTGPSNVSWMSGTPKIQLIFQLNNLKNNSTKNRPLYYNSFPSHDGSSPPDIVNLRTYREKGIPKLAFKILQKRVLSDNQETRTGEYFEVILRKSEKSHGLEYLGDIYHYTKENKLTRKGVIRLYFRPNYYSTGPTSTTTW